MMRSVVTTVRSSARSLELFGSSCSKLPRSTANIHRSLATLQQDGGMFPELKELRKYPLVGSMLPIPWDGNTLPFFRKLMKENGPFFSFGMPGLGSDDIYGTLYVIRDPQEMLRLLKKEGQYPSGAVQRIWPSIHTLKLNGYNSVGLFETGPEWQRLRRFMQQDLFSPQAARGYSNEILQGTQQASGKATLPEFQGSDGLHKFFNYSALDMFAGVLFGGKQHLGDDYDDFCRAAVENLELIRQLTMAPKEIIAYKVFGLTTSKFKRFQETFAVIHEIAMRRFGAYQDYIARVGDDGLTQEEKNSYFYKILKRQPDSNVTAKECLELCVLLLTAAVDTTAAKTSWNVLHLGLRPDIQDELRSQLLKAVDKHGGLVPAIYDNINEEIPLLPAVIRESHRLTPVIFGDLQKVCPEDTEIYGRILPAGSNVMFDGLTNMMDETLVEDPMDFKPQRWFKSAVEARKGTPQAVIDHPFYSGPFSQGARRCPGSRVAYVEIQCILSRMLLDYNIEGPASMHWSEVNSEMRLMEVPTFPDEVKFVPRV